MRSNVLISRRTCLRGLGVALALPLMETMGWADPVKGAAAYKAPVRLGFQKLVEAVLGLVGFPAEADGAAPEAQDADQRHVRGGSLAEGFQGLEAEADDFGGEAEFVLGFGVVDSEHLEGGEAGEDDVQDGGCATCSTSPEHTDVHC